MKLGYLKFNGRLFFVSLAVFVFGLSAKAQPASVYADPAVGGFDITTITDNSVSANALLSNTVYKLKLYIFNLDQVNAIPPGTVQIKIGLGSRLKLDPAFDLSTAPYSAYFTWSTTTIGSQVQIFGVLINPLPADFVGQLSFNVRALSPATQGTSTISANFLISNDNPAYNFSDLQPANNSASLQYTLAAQTALPVNFTQFTASNKNCSVNVNWSVGQEINLSKYLVEFSKDGLNYTTVSTVAAQNKSSYSAVVPVADIWKAPVLFVRIKSVDLDNSFKYTNVIQVSGTCGGKNLTGVFGYPNPVERGSSFINVSTRDGVFNGSYHLTLTDISGKVHAVKDVNLSNVVNFRFELNTITAPGKYFISIRKTDTGETSLIQFEKM